MAASAERLSETEYRLLIQHAPVLIWRAGLDQRHDYVNETWRSFTGCSAALGVSEAWAESVHPEDLARCSELLRGHFERRTAFELTYRLRRHDGVYRTMCDRGAPYHDDNGTFSGFVGSCLDIDDRHQAELERQTFLAMLAHELRTPLSPLRALPVVIDRRMAAGQGIGRDLTGLLRRQVMRFASLVDQLTEVSSGGYDALPYSFSEFDLGVLMVELVQDRQITMIESGGHKVQLELGPTEGAYPVMADRIRIGQTLLSLLENAIKYTPDDGAVCITLRRVPGPGYAMTVSDHGIGIPERELSRVGQRYFRGSNATESHYPGIGLGLAIARETLERHQGTLQIESTLGQGTRVTALLPARRACEDGALDASP